MTPNMLFDSEAEIIAPSLRGARDKIAKQFCAEATTQSMPPHTLKPGLLRGAPVIGRAFARPVGSQ
jgi:hypothetical protein